MAAAKEALQRAPIELNVYVSDRLQDPSKKDGLVKSKSGNLYYKKPNTTNRLRTLYGNIQRSLQPRGKGNISDVTLQQGRVIVTYGYDTSATVKAGTRSQTLEYAKINEAKRPFLLPGFNEYMKDAQGFKALMNELSDAIIELAD